MRERKQAEFLVEEFFPWELVERIGVIDKRSRRASWALWMTRPIDLRYLWPETGTTREKHHG